MPFDVCQRGTIPLFSWIVGLNRSSPTNPPIDYDLASSTRPVWTLRELLALSGPNDLDALLDTRVSCTNAAGTLALRIAIAKWKPAFRSRKDGGWSPPARFPELPPHRFRRAQPISEFARGTVFVS
jgi:hypothetical protein